MKLMGRIGYFFQNLSGRTLREIIAIAVILLISAVLSLSVFFSDAEKSREQKKAGNEFKTAVPVAQDPREILFEKADGLLSDTLACSLIVMRQDAVLHEKYFGGSGPDDYNNVFSVTKSVVSALTGICIREKFIGGTEDKLARYFPEEVGRETDKRWQDITLGHILTMTPGFVEDLDPWTASSDWIDATFRLPLNYRPGERFQYANSASHLLSVVLTKASGMSTYELAEKFLFKPMNITQKKWSQDPAGNYTGYANLFLRPRDMAKFGRLYLNKGKWEGKQLIPQKWVEESTTVRYDFNKEEDKGYTNGYGYKWWINGETGYYMYSALGYGGQSINVIPELELVVVITAMPSYNPTITDELRIRLLKEYIIPACYTK